MNFHMSHGSYEMARKTLHWHFSRVTGLAHPRPPPATPGHPARHFAKGARNRTVKLDRDRDRRQMAPPTRRENNSRPRFNDDSSHRSDNSGSGGRRGKEPERKRECTHTHTHTHTHTEIIQISRKKVEKEESRYSNSQKLRTWKGSDQSMAAPID